MQPLADTLRRAPVPAVEAVQLAAALADALAAKVRDKTRPPRITPGTVLIGRRDDGTLTVEFKAGALPAPSGPVGADERAAVQELGVICYRLLTGKPPIKGNVSLIRDLEAAVSSSSQPDALKALVLELISVDPARRPGLETAAERFEAIARGTPLPTASSLGAPAPLPPPPRAGGAKATTPPPTPPAAATSSPRPAPPPITVEPLEAPADLVPAAPVLPAEPVVVASTTKSKKKKNSTDTQERLFFAEGERLAAEERAEAALETAESGERTDIDVESVGGVWWRERRVLVAAAGGVVLLGLLLYLAFGRGGGGDKDEKSDDPLASSAAKAPEDPVDTAKVAAAPEPPAPAATPTPTPTTAQPEPPAAEPEPPAAEPEPPAAEPEPPAPAKPESKKPTSSAKSKTPARSKTPPPVAKPAAKPKETPKSSSSGDPMAQARAARARGRSSEAYNYYAQAARSGKNVGAATFGMAEMAYAMKKYGDAISLAKKAMSKGASEKACWKIVAKSHCARHEGRSAWFAFSKAGGGDCP